MRFRRLVAAPFAAKKKAVTLKRAANEDQMFKDTQTNGNDSGNGKVAPKTGASLNSFMQRLDYLIKGGSQTKRMTIKPDQAEAILETWNTRNRPLTRTKYRKYAATMAANRWRYTGEPIIFSTQRLIDGQHRLAGCVAAGVPIDVLLVFGAPDNAFPFIDVGWKRTAGDIFSINGVENASMIAAAVQWIYGYETGIIGSAARSSAVSDHEQLYEIYLEHKGVDDSVWVGHVFTKSRLAPPSLMVALHYLCAKKHRHMADEFFEKTAEGIGVASKKDPIHRLRSRLIENAASQEKMGRKQIAALTIKAWNARRLNREVGTLKFGADESFPKVI